MHFDYEGSQLKRATTWYLCNIKLTAHNINHAFISQIITKELKDERRMKSTGILLTT
jgi:hypothetical protein